LVNALLARGWILLNIRTNDYGHPTERYTVLFYTLGNTDPSADIEFIKAELREQDSQIPGLKIK
jgi:hypothetical protein